MSRQAQKSSLTRERITIATLECIVEFGYVGTTMARITRIAEVSSGSMQYHFTTKADAIKAAIRYLHLKRLSDQRHDLDNIPPGVDPMDYSVDVYWKHLNEGHFVAYQELVLASRTDTDLAEVLKPEYRKFVRAWRDYALANVPAWQKASEHFELISDIGQCQMEGLAFGLLNDQISKQQVEEVLEFCKGLLRSLIENPRAS